MFGYSMGPSWVEIYGLIIAFIVLGVVALAFVLNASVFNKSKENQISGGMKSMFNLFSLKGHVFESLLKVTTLSIITYNVLMIPVGFNAGFMAGFISMVSTLILGVLGVYVAGMALMMLYRVFVTVSEINARDKGVAFDPENPYGLVKPVAPVQQPYYGAPVQQPYYGAPEQNMYQAAPAPAPVTQPAPAPVPQPVPAPVPQPAPVAQPAPADEKACTTCGKSIKAAAKFCPYCGNTQ